MTSELQIVTSVPVSGIAVNLKFSFLLFGRHSISTLGVVEVLMSVTPLIFKCSISARLTLASSPSSRIEGFVFFGCLQTLIQ